MTREILFKAKRINNGEWVEGNLFIDDKKNKCEISIGYTNCRVPFEVDPNTICQYTGLTDKNGNKIWENDVVKGVAYSSERIGIIVWINELAGFGVRYREQNDPTAWENASILKCATSGWKNQFAAEVIGNIFDNPELLGGGK